MSRSGGAQLEAIEAVYRQRLAELRRVATAITGSREAGLDAVQDAFALAVHRRGQFRGKGSLEAWIWRIVVHRARDVAATLARSRTFAADGVAPVEPADDRSSGRVGDVQVLLRELPERQLLALFLHYYADLDYATIAETLGVSPGTVGATLNQARQSLRRSLAEVAL
jgi:RNA polymerase sigma factor (sigma-70 family)